MNKKSKYLRFLSGFLASLTIFGTVSGLGILPVYAAEAAEEEEEEEVIDYYTQVYNTPEEKLATMTEKVTAYGYSLYYEEYTGEVALKNDTTGEIMFSNPYDVATSNGSNPTKDQLLSQIIIKYTDNDQEKNYYSYVEAAQRKQIYVKNVKDGIRVEYTIGEEETRNLVPRLVEKTRFEEQILSNITDEQALKKINAFYTLKDPDDPKLTTRGIAELKATFPITSKMAVYVFDPYASQREINLIEAYIKQYCPQYTFAELDADHQMTEYSGSDTAPALFKMSLEYYLNEDGLQVRLPANGIRFDETTYQLTYIQVLPYMGCGNYNNEGYTFIPDGSGSIIRFEDFAGNPLTLSGKVYGQDYAYHELSAAHQEVMRLPVYGVVEKIDKGEFTYDSIVKSTDDKGKETEETVKVKANNDGTKGYLAIITEGDALANITTSHGGALHQYATVYPQFYPRPKDSYNLAESISVGSNATWTVVSKRKYTGSYRIQYIMLTDPEIAAEKNISDYYTTEWTGMAKAYRDYLEKNQAINKISTTKADIPLYIESFGVIDTQEVILSIPVMVKTPLTTFDDLETMYDQLSEKGITNVVYKLTGYTNGGMWFTYPTKVKFERKAGGNGGYNDFMDYASSKGISVYPDFDFMYVQKTSLTDGVNFRKDAVKTIDNRYTQRREYDAVEQRYTRMGMLAISPSVLEKLYTKFVSSYSKFTTNGISVSTLGSDLNSDFDKKDPYNRADAEEFVVNLLDEMKANYGSLMMDSGNAYALKYADHLLNVSLDSSRYYYSSQSVPFLGMVLHGYIPFAGTPTNMAGDINYEILKIIENGASPYFTLSYQNTAKLKDDFDLSKYYSINYDIWFEDLCDKYGILNDALKDVQTAEITDCEFLLGERVATADEIAADKAEADAEAQAKAEAEAKAQAKAELANKLAQRKAEEAGEDYTAPAAAGNTTTAAADKTEEDTGYVKTKYTVALGTIVKVTYANGISFILNFNSYDVTVDGTTVGALNFVKIGK